METTTTRGDHWSGKVAGDIWTRPMRVIRLERPVDERPAEMGSSDGAEAVHLRLPVAGAKRESLVERLQKRKMVQWTAAYLAMAWVVLQLVQILSEAWAWPMVVQQAGSLVLGLGTLPTLVIAWFHGEKGRQDVCACEAVIVAALIMGSVFVIWSFCVGGVA